jgi:Ca-activated chloride channel homolog
MPAPHPSPLLLRPARVVVALLACGLLTAGVLAAGSTGLASAHENGDGAPGKLLLVMDSSGSMKEPASGGVTKIVAAKKALRTVISRLPDGQPVGLRVYGATVFSRGEAGACTDSQLKVPVAAGNHRQLLAAVNSYRPYGETPIGYALQQAGHDLGTAGKRSIVLVSDGEPTCAPDPCKVARQLVGRGIDLKIDVVGLDVGSQARAALQCVAAAGHGTYYDVTDSRDFVSSLQKVATRAARPFTTIGRPVSGGDASTTAPTITNGDWLDRTNGASDRFYIVRRTQSGSTVHFSAAFRDPDTTVFNTVALTTPAGDSCGASGAVEQLATNTLVSAAATAGPIDTFGDFTPHSPCATATTLIAKVTYSGDTRGVPIEIRVTELPGVDNATSLPRPVEEPHWVAPPSGASRPVHGGTSFDDAPVLAGGSYSDDIVQGETLTYQVDLDWGQQLTAEVGLPALSDQRAAAATGSPLAKLSVFSPARTPASATSVDSHFPGKFLTRYPQVLGTVSGPVAFLNTSSTDPAIGGADVAGRYTVTVFLGHKPGGRSIPVPFRLDLGVTGTPHGKPDFATAPTSPDDPSVQPPSSGAASGTRDEQPPTATAGSGGAFPIRPVLGGLGLVALLAAGAVALRSLRHRAG